MEEIVEKALSGDGQAISKCSSPGNFGNRHHGQHVQGLAQKGMTDVG